MQDNNQNKIFEQSLRNMTARDICESKKKKRNTSGTAFSVIRYALIAVCAFALIFSGTSIVKSLIGYADQEKIYDEIKDIVINDASGVEMMFDNSNVFATPDYNASQDLTKDEIDIIGSTEQINKEYARIKIKLSRLKSQYPDLYGWITVPGTVINYPIMQAEDNEYYLYRSYTGASLTAGSIYADYKNEEAIRDNYNLVLFGHHMMNGSMFGSLDRYLTEKNFRKDNTIYIYTIDGMYTYKIFSVYETSKYFPYIETRFSSSEDYIEFLNRTKDLSLYQVPDLKLDENTRIITLSTCNNRYDDGRFAVHGYLTDFYEADKVKK